MAGRRPAAVGESEGGFPGPGGKAPVVCSCAARSRAWIASNWSVDANLVRTAGGGRWPAQHQRAVVRAAPGRRGGARRAGGQRAEPGRPVLAGVERAPTGIVDDEAEGRLNSRRPGSPAVRVPLATPSSATRRAAQSLDLREPGRVQWRAATESARAWLFAAGNRRAVRQPAQRVSRRARAADPLGLAAAWPVRILCARSGRLSWPLLCQLSGEILPMQWRRPARLLHSTVDFLLPLPGMPAGKPAGVRCLHLDENHLCGLFPGRPERLAVCGQFSADPEICGDSREQALS